MKEIELIANAIAQEDQLVIVGHAMPDGDCIGSVLGLFLGLQQLGKNVQAILANKVPPLYHYLPSINGIEVASKPIPAAASVIFLDCGDEERIGEDILPLLAERRLTFNLDHHRGNPNFGDYNYIDVEAAATAEIVYELLLAMQVAITTEIADALLAGIVMDTGSFMNGNTTANSMRIAAELLDVGADIDRARINLFESKPREEIMLLGRALNHLEFALDGRVAWISLPYDEVAAIGAMNLYPEGLINYTRMIDGVELGMLFREIEPGVVKVGFRSKGQVDVAGLARRFDGGGHMQAAGARQAGSMREVTERVLKAVKDVMA